MIFSIIAEIIGKRLDRLRESEDFKERKKNNLSSNFLWCMWDI